MAEGRRRERWTHTSHLMALFANCHRDPKKGKPLAPRDFDPYARRSDRHADAIPADISALKVFVARSDELKNAERTPP